MIVLGERACSMYQRSMNSVGVLVPFKYGCEFSTITVQCVGILHCRNNRPTLPSLPAPSNLYSSIECKAQEGQKQHWETAFFSMSKCIVDE